MMNILEEAIIYATVMHQGTVRKFKGIPYILHPLEVAQILSTITDDQEVITAGILHDIVEGTDGTLSKNEKRFGKRVAFLVSSDTEDVYSDEEMSATWQRRKEGTLRILQGSEDISVKIPLSDPRSAQLPAKQPRRPGVSERGEMYSKQPCLSWYLYDTPGI